MNQDSPNPQINVSKIPGGGGFAGAVVAIGSMLIFLFGIPRLRLFLLASIILGCAVALILRFIRRETPGKPWILSGTQEADSLSTKQTPARPAEDSRRKLHLGRPAILGRVGTGS